MLCSRGGIYLSESLHAGFERESQVGGHCAGDLSTLRSWGTKEASALGTAAAQAQVGLSWRLFSEWFWQMLDKIMLGFLHTFPCSPTMQRKPFSML